ncbi:MAG: PKD domain-containing protein [Candidatus Saccharibacteria bacterium]
MGVFHVAQASKKVRVLGLLIVAMLGMASMFVQPRALAAVSFGGPFDCDNNAVVNCGAKDAATLVSAYNAQSSVRAIYSSFGIDSSDVQSIGDTAVAGTVTKTGNVYIGNQLVATNVVTAGRQNITGSTQVNYGGVTFYKRAPSVSFSNNSLTAYVVMNNGQFKFAILSACGNPVTGTPTPPAKAALACKQLLLTPGVIEKNGDQAYTFGASASVTNGSITNYVFNLGNGSNETVTTSNMTAQSSSHTYAPGTYHVSVTINGVAGNVYTSAPSPVSCTGDFTVKPTVPVPPLTCATGSTDESCKPTCTAPNGQTYPVGSSECTPTPPVVTVSTPPTTTLPNTGAGNVIGLFFGVVIAAAAAHRLFKRKATLAPSNI